MVNVLKFLTLHFLFSKKMWVIRAGIHKLFVRIANREEPDQTASLEAVCFGSRPFWQATSVQNFRTFTVYIIKAP